MLDDARHTNRVLYQARQLCERQAAAAAEQANPALVDALGAGALALAEKALAAAVVEFAGLKAPDERAWYPWLFQHQDDNTELARLYVALTEGELSPLITPLDTAGTTPIQPARPQPGMIASDSGTPSLDSTLAVFSGLLRELRDSAIEW